MPGDIGRSLKIWLVPGHGGAHVNAKQRQADVFEFMGSLIYIGSARPSKIA